MEEQGEGEGGSSPSVGQTAKTEENNNRTAAQANAQGFDGQRLSEAPCQKHWQAERVQCAGEVAVMR